MDWDQIKRNWQQVSDKIKVTWGKLSEDNLAAIAGRSQRARQPARTALLIRNCAGEDEVDDFAQSFN